MKYFFKKKEGMGKGRRSIVFVFAAVALTAILAVGVSAASSLLVPVRWDSTQGSIALREDALLIDGVTYVPFRAFCVLASNCEVSWDASSRTAYATTIEGATISARVGNEYIEFGQRVFYTVVPNRVVNDRLYVAVRPLAKCFGIDVNWHAPTRSVYLTHTGEIPRHDVDVYDADALYWLSRIINAEAAGEPFLGRVAVGNVVLNRVDSQNYPDTVYEVIFDKAYGVQFTPAANGSVYGEPSAEAVRAAKICLEGYTLSDRIMYFFNPSIATGRWITANRTYAFRIGQHVFYT